MAIYNDQDPKFSNENLNPIGSEYASKYGHSVTDVVARVTNERIFDARPTQFYDLALLNKIPAIDCGSDEFIYAEAGWQRRAVMVTGSAGATSYPTAQTVPVGNMDEVSENIILIYPNGQKGTVVGVDKANSVISVMPMVGGSLPALTNNDSLGNMSVVDHDGSEGFASHFRLSTIERSNYIQIFNRAIKYDEIELIKMEKSGTYTNRLSMEKEEMYNQQRIDISNAVWMGEKGEVITRRNRKAKTTGGILRTMDEAGSPRISATQSTMVDAFEDLVMSTEYRNYGYTRFAYMTPRIHRMISKAYKSEKTRYKPDEKGVIANLESIDIGSSKIVLVPFARFADESSFPSYMQNEIVLVDHQNLKRKQIYKERAGETKDNFDHGIPRRTKTFYVDQTMGLEINNPLSFGRMTVTK